MKLCPEAMKKVVQIAEVEGSASAWHRYLALGAGVSVISVANLLYDAFTLGCGNGMYTSHFRDAFY